MVALLASLPAEPLYKRRGKTEKRRRKGEDGLCGIRFVSAPDLQSGEGGLEATRKKPHKN
jgi:hypothetical protein